MSARHASDATRVVAEGPPLLLAKAPSKTGAALRGAYADALSLACRRLDVSPPRGGDRAPQAEIYRVEAALRQRGLDVRREMPETAAH